MFKIIKIVFFKSEYRSFMRFWVLSSENSDEELLNLMILEQIRLPSKEQNKTFYTIGKFKKLSLNVNKELTF